MKLPTVDPFARENHGLLTRAAAARLGVSKSSWYRAHDSGLLVPIHPSVSRLAGAPITWEQRVAAAVLASPGSRASHRSAARLLGVEGPPDDVVEIIQPRRTSTQELHDVVIHHPRDLLDLNAVRRQNILVTNILRTLCDLGAVAPQRVAPAFGHFVAVGSVRPASIAAAIAVHGRPGRAGIGALRAALADWSIRGAVPDSVLEPAMRRLLVRHGIVPWQFHAVIAGYEVDFWLTGTRVILECDGWKWHGKTPGQFERDTDRRADLASHGYVVVPFTYSMIIRRGAVVITRIRSALEAFAA